MDETTRLALPLLAAGQAQKEMLVNEALARLDLLVQASVTAVGVNAPPAAPADGEAWVVGPVPSGAWTGHADAVAGWTAGGWRFVNPTAGMTVWSVADGCLARWSEGAWSVGLVATRQIRIDGKRVVGPQGAAVAAPAGGAVVDVEARSVIAAIIARLASHGLIAH